MCLRKHRKNKIKYIRIWYEIIPDFLFMYSSIFKLTWAYTRRLQIAPNIKDIYFIRFVI